MNKYQYLIVFCYLYGKFTAMTRLLFLTGFIIMFAACARVGRPTGGEKDTTPPKLIFSRPSNMAVNYKGNEIILQFDEFVTIKDIQKNLLISPPPQQMPTIIPAGIASKKFILKFQEPLQEHTTYSLNFGESIADYNEGNPLKNYQLIFSTGSQIDSLQYKGKVIPVYQNKKAKKIIIGLYPATQFTDSLVFKEKPYYVTVAGKNGDFTFTHLKPGNYKLIAINDENNDYKYKPGNEQIGFINKPVRIPGDSSAIVYLFREPMRPSIEKIKQISANHIQINFTGETDSLKIKELEPVSKKFIIKKYALCDYWYDTSSDSIHLAVQLNGKEKKYHKKRIDEKDSLVIHLNKTIRINLQDTLRIKANMPVSKWNENKMIFLQDSLPVSHQFKINNKGDLDVFFEKIPEKTYQLTLFPKSITGFNGEKLKDTVKSNIRIPALESYGNLQLNIQKTDSVSLFVELIQNKQIIRKSKSSTKPDFKIKNLLPGKYKLRIVFDTNANNRWDRGDYLRHQQAEKTFEPEQEIEIRANWDVHQKYDLSRIK